MSCYLAINGGRDLGVAGRRGFCHHRVKPHPRLTCGGPQTPAYVSQFYATPFQIRFCLCVTLRETVFNQEPDVTSFASTSITYRQTSS